MIHIMSLLWESHIVLFHGVDASCTVLSGLSWLADESCMMCVHCSTESGSVLMPKSAQDLLLNMSVGNGDMSIPSVYHYLPHLIGKPSSLTPVVKLSKGRAGGKRSSMFIICVHFSSLYYVHKACVPYPHHVWVVLSHDSATILYLQDGAF